MDTRQFEIMTEKMDMIIYLLGKILEEPEEETEEKQTEKKETKKTDEFTVKKRE